MNQSYQYNSNHNVPGSNTQLKTNVAKPRNHIDVEDSGDLSSLQPPRRFNSANNRLVSSISEQGDRSPAFTVDNDSTLSVGSEIASSLSLQPPHPLANARLSCTYRKKSPSERDDCSLVSSTNEGGPLSEQQGAGPVAHEGTLSPTSLSISTHSVSSEDRQQPQPSSSITLSPFFHSTSQIGFHSWVLIKATRDDIVCCTALCTYGLSFIVTLFQIIVLYVVIFEAYKPGCNNHDNCHAGQYCGIFENKQPFLTSTPTCFDCDKATSQDEQDYCEDEDEYYKRCDYIVKFHEGMRLSNVIVLIFTFVYVAHQIIKDMDQSSKETAVAMRCVEKNIFNKNSQKWLSLFYIWYLYYYRKYVLPGLTIIATVALMITAPLTSQNILLNGVGVSIVSLFDEEIMALFMFSEVQYETRKTMSSMLQVYYDQPGTRGRERCQWVWNRIYCATLVCLALVTTIKTELIVKKTPAFLFPGFPNASSKEDFFHCDDLTYALLLPGHVVLSFSVIDAITMAMNMKHGLSQIGVILFGPLVCFFFPLFATQLAEGAHFRISVENNYTSSLL